eukprot:COSAG01_NODE_283_length_19477_cov_44.267468_3_plen_263_part_00
MTDVLTRPMEQLHGGTAAASCAAWAARGVSAAERAIEAAEALASTSTAAAPPPEEPTIISPRSLSRGLRSRPGATPSAYANVYSRRYMQASLPLSPRFAVPTRRPTSGRRAAAAALKPRPPPTSARDRVSPPAEKSPSPPREAGPMAGSQVNEDNLRNWLKQKEERKAADLDRLQKRRERDVAYTARLQRRQDERLKLARKESGIQSRAIELEQKVGALPGTSAMCENIAKLREEIQLLLNPGDAGSAEMSPRYLPRRHAES